MAKLGKRHGLNATKARIMVQGLSSIDKRTLAAQALLDWKESLVRDLGGPQAISTQEATLVEMAVRGRLIIEHVDAFILSQESLVNKKRRQIYPIVRERNTLVNTLANLLGQLGLAKREPPMKSLAEYLAEKDRRADEHTGEHERSEAVSEEVPAEEEVAVETPGN